MDNHVTNLRAMLLKQLDILRSANGETLGIEIRRAKAMAEMAQVIVNTARVEVEYVNALKGGSQSNFLHERDEADNTETKTPLAADDVRRLGGPSSTHPWRGNVTRHRL